MDSSAAIEHSDQFQLPPTEDDGSVHMYWLDIHEDAKNAPGRVYLFGKVCDILFSVH